MGKITTVTLTPAIGGVVQGVDLSKPLDDQQISEIRASVRRTSANACLLDGPK